MTARIKRGDRLPALTLTLTGDDGPIDLTTATAVRLLVADRGGTLVIDATLDDRPDDGVLTYAWADGDTDTAGTYRVEVEVTWPDSKKQTFPGGDYGSLFILPDLG